MYVLYYSIIMLYTYTYLGIPFVFLLLLRDSVVTAVVIQSTYNIRIQLKITSHYVTSYGMIYRVFKGVVIIFFSNS